MEWETNGKPDFGFPPHVYTTEVGGQMLLLNFESEQYFGLDAVGTNIVTRLTKQSSESALTDLENDYEVDVEILRHNVDHLVEKLLTAGLLMRFGRPD